MKSQNWIMFLMLILTIAGASWFVACGDDDDDDDDDLAEDDDDAAEDDDDAAGDDDNDDLTANCTEMCEKHEECEGDLFDDMFGSMEFCILGCKSDAEDEPIEAECFFACDTSMECTPWNDCLDDCFVG